MDGTNERVFTGKFTLSRSKIFILRTCLTFQQEHTDEFRDFIDFVVNVPPKYTPPVVPPAYATPTTILARLSQSSREGFPSLPYLIDQPRAFASLVMMWDKWYPMYRQKYPGTRLDGDLARFHSTCLNIRERMRECVEKAENAERPSSSLSMRWEEVAERVAATSPVWTSQGGLHPPMWPAPNSNGDRNASSKFNSTKGHKILGVGNVCGTSVDDGVIGNGWEGPNMHNLLTKKTLSEFVGGFRKKVQGKAEKEKEKEREKEREQRELEKEREKEEKKEKERLKREARKEASKEVAGEWRFVAVADGHPHGHGHHDYSDIPYLKGRDR